MAMTRNRFMKNCNQIKKIFDDFMADENWNCTSNLLYKAAGGYINMMLYAALTNPEESDDKLIDLEVNDLYLRFYEILKLSGAEFEQGCQKLYQNLKELY